MLMLAGCRSAAVQITATATPLPTLLPTSSPTPPPTLTETPPPSPTSPPTATSSPTPPPTSTETPLVFGAIRSRQRVNVRKGAGVDFSIFESLAPGSDVQVLGQNEDNTWYNIKLDNGDEGWVRADLLFIEDTPTPVPTASATVDPADEVPMSDAPLVDVDSIYLTATALAGDSTTAVPASPTATASPTAAADIIEAPTRLANVPRVGVDVFAFCNDSRYGTLPPRDLAAGSSIEIFWAWYATTDAYLQQHISNASHELRVNGVQIANVNQFRLPARTEGRDRVIYWYVPFGPLDAGDYQITYRVTWQNPISDGYSAFGPGAATEFEEESCTFVVR